MRTWNAGQWMALGFVAAFLLGLLADAADNEGELAARAAGFARLLAALGLLAFTLALHRGLSQEPVSAVLLVGTVFAAYGAFVAISQMDAGVALAADGSLFGSRRGEVALGAAMAGSAVLAARRHPALPQYAWKACAVLALLGAVAVAGSLRDARILVLGGLASSLFLFSASMFAWQAARVQVRPARERGWAFAR